MLSRLTVALTLATLALLPWSWFPPFPWLHVHAQWSDALFAAAALCWLLDRWQPGGRPTWPRLRPAHLAMASYLGWAALSFCFAAPVRPPGAGKLLGMAELVALAVVTAELAGRPGVLARMARVVAWNSLAIAAAAAVGLALFYRGIPTLLIGTFGDLPAAPWYARVQAGMTHPNLLASYGLFAAALIAHEEAELPPALRRAALAATALTVLLTFSRAVLGFILGAVIRAVRTPRQRLAALLLAAASAAVILALSFRNLQLDPARPLPVRMVADPPASRREGFASAWRTLARHPRWGSGPGSSPGARWGAPFDAHCTPLNVAATLGLPALGALVALMVMLWRGRDRPTDRATWSGLAGLGLDALASDVEDFRHLWVLIGLADRRRPGDPAEPVREGARG